jgi:predicted RNase H-like nuclease
VTHPDATVAGIDGARAGWLCVLWRGAALDIRLLRDAAEILALPATSVVVDMPIGLSEAGPRACDLAARGLLPPRRRSSVFTPPKRYMLDLPYAAANAVGKAREGKGLSKQAWYLGRRIAALDAILDAESQTRIVEAHPEVIFHALNAWAPLPRKTEAAGQSLRLDLLNAAGLPDPAGLLGRFPASQVCDHDVLDAAACALTARRRRTGEAVRLPANAPAPRDVRGLRMEIWY